MNRAIEAGGFLFWADDIKFVQASDDVNGYFVRITLKSGAELRVDAQSYKGMNELKSKIYNAMIEASKRKGR